MNEIVEESIAFSVEGDRCEGVLAYPASGTATENWLLLAPHPQMGGRMSNNVVCALAQAGAGAGRATLRFNYRGVGESELSLPDGVGLFDYWRSLEHDRRYDLLLPDITAANEFLTESVPSSSMVVIGYSLGAILAGMSCELVNPGGIIAIAPPTARVSLGAFEGLTVSTMFITTRDDFAFSRQRFLDEYEKLSGPKTHVEFSSADHFFRGMESQLAELLTAQTFPPQAARQ